MTDWRAEALSTLETIRTLSLYDRMIDVLLAFAERYAAEQAIESGEELARVVEQAEAEQHRLQGEMAEKVAEEREACAQLAEAAYGAGAHTPPQRIIAAAIRARQEG